MLIWMASDFFRMTHVLRAPVDFDLKAWYDSRQYAFRVLKINRVWAEWI